jgi:hypothetical protein
MTKSRDLLRTAHERAKLPAYARELIEKRRRGLAPVSALFIAATWDLRKAASWRIVVPETEDPAQLDFRVVAGLDCVLCGRDKSRMDTIARAIIPFGPKRLMGLHYGGRAFIIYWPSEVAIECAA